MHGFGTLALIKFKICRVSTTLYCQPVSIAFIRLAFLEMRLVAMQLQCATVVNPGIDLIQLLIYFTIADNQQNHGSNLIHNRYVILMILFFRSSSCAASQTCDSMMFHHLDTVRLSLRKTSTQSPRFLVNLPPYLQRERTRPRHGQSRNKKKKKVT